MSCGLGCMAFAPDDPECRDYGLGAPALRYARMGYAVFPLARGSKRPHRMLGDHGGVYHATDDEDRIRGWWSADMSANVGVATGGRSGLVVVDMDVKNGDNGTESFFMQFLPRHALQPGDFGLPWPAGIPTARTPSGGAHQWLRVPPGARVPERPGILPGVDVKGDGGYVVAAPSMIAVTPSDRSGGSTGEIPVPYEWAAGCPHNAPNAPGWVAGWLDKAVSTGTVKPVSGLSGASGPDVPDGSSGLVPGERNRRMYAYTCSLLRQYGTTPSMAATVRDAVQALYEKSDTSGYPWSEVLTSMNSARKFIEHEKEKQAEKDAKYVVEHLPRFMFPQGDE